MRKPFTIKVIVDPTFEEDIHSYMIFLTWLQKDGDSEEGTDIITEFLRDNLPDTKEEDAFYIDKMMAYCMGLVNLTFGTYEVKGFVTPDETNYPPIHTYSDITVEVTT